MGLFDAIDKLLEPITNRIFATDLGKSIKPLSCDEFFANNPDLNQDASYSSLPGNVFHQTWIDQHESHCLDDD